MIIFLSPVQRHMTSQCRIVTQPSLSGCFLLTPLSTGLHVEIAVCILFPFSKPDTVLRLSTRLFPFFLLFLFLVDYLLLHFKVLFKFGTQYIDELLDLICAYKTTHIYLYMLIHLEDSLFRKCIINYGLNNSKTTKNQCTMNNSESKDIQFPKNIC